MPKVSNSLKLPFSEAIAFFRQKLNVKTAAWTDIYGLDHDKAFMVAGAMKDDLINDFKVELDKAIAQGTGYEQWRKNFPKIVKKHGWSYNGGEGWRSRVIYHTNIQQSFNAGNLVQAKAIADKRPYWEYVHNAHGSSKTPRPQHLAWNGLILRHDDPWWNSHRPMNGWGCNCGFNVLSERDLKKTGRTRPDAAPKIEWEEKIVGIRGPNPRAVLVPKGIDAGFENAVGSSVLSTLLKKRFEQISQLPLAVSAVSALNLLASEKTLTALTKDFAQWVDNIKNKQWDKVDKIRHIGVLEKSIVTQLKDNNIDLSSIVISIKQKEITHLLAEARKGIKSFTLDQVKNLPLFLAKPDAVIWDSLSKRPALFFVFSVNQKKSGRITVRVNYSNKEGVTNSVRSGSIVNITDLKLKGMKLLSGEI